MQPELASLAGDLAAARRGSGPLVSAARLVGLDPAQAMEVQGEVHRLMGGGARVAKVAATADGGLAAPVPDCEVVASGGTLPVGGGAFLGLEIEVAAVLARDLGPEEVAAGPEAIRAAISHCILGIELIGTRIDDRTKGGDWGPLADGMIGAGYVLGRQMLADIPAVDGLRVTAEIDGIARDPGLARHPFGGVIPALAGYSRRPFDRFGGFRAGMTITTGSLTPLIEVPPRCDVVLTIEGFEPVRVRLAGAGSRWKAAHAL